MGSPVTLVEDTLIPPHLIDDANACWFTRGRARRGDHRVALVVDGRVVGFVTPHETRWGWRLGPIYIDPEARGRGLLAAVYEHYRDRPLVAFVADDNPASQVAHERAGFARWKRGNGGWFLRRAAG